MNNTIQKIKEKLANNQGIKILEETDNSIKVQPEGENTFPVTLIAEPDKFNICFQGWNEEFSSEDDALDCFAFGLSDDCRLKVVCAGGVEYKWILQVKENNKWVSESEKSIGLFPFWQKKEIKYFHNKIIKNK